MTGFNEIIRGDAGVRTNSRFHVISDLINELIKLMIGSRDQSIQEQSPVTVRGLLVLLENLEVRFNHGQHSIHIVGVIAKFCGVDIFRIESRPTTVLGSTCSMIRNNMVGPMYSISPIAAL